MNGLEIGTLAVYLVAVIAIGLWARRRETPGDFLIANRSVGTLLTTASISAVIGGVVLGSHTALGFDFGAGALWLAAGTASGLALLGTVAKKIRVLADEHGFLTLSDYLFTEFDSRTAYLGAVLVFAAFLFLLAAQFIVGGQLFASLAPLEYPSAVIVMGVVTLAYVLVGGFKAVIRTDLLQFAVMFLVFIVLVPLHVDVSELELEFDIGSPGPLRMASFYLSGVAGLFVGADIWQRVYSARNGTVARNSLFLAALVWLVFGTCLVLLGIAARGGSSVTADQALFYGLFAMLPQELGGVATVALLAALMSTIDTEVFLLASSVAKDFVARSREVTADEMTRIVRVAMVCVTLPAMAIAIYWPSVLDALFIFSSLLIALFPAIFVSLIRPVAPQVAFASILIGSLLLAPSFLLGWVSLDTAPLLVLLGASAAILLGSVRFRSA